jgi:hypothetical protein
MAKKQSKIQTVTMSGVSTETVIGEVAQGDTYKVNQIEYFYYEQANYNVHTRVGRFLTKI